MCWSLKHLLSVCLAACFPPGPLLPSHTHSASVHGIQRNINSLSDFHYGANTEFSFKSSGILVEGHCRLWRLVGFRQLCVFVFTCECLKQSLLILKYEPTIVSYSQYGLVVNCDNSLTELKLHTWVTKM